jgi:CHAT domain-containing protein
VPRIKILILTANPVNTTHLQLEREVSEIEDALQGSTLRDHFEIISRGAVTVDDLSATIQRYNPDLVHFSGHGTGENGLVLEDKNGKLKLVPDDALAEVFRLAKKSVKCVFLNACYSEKQAEVIYQQIDCVIGMNRPIGDQTAIQFSPKFYAALAEGSSFQNAFDWAKTFLRLGSNPEATTPVQKIRQDATNLFSTSQLPDEAMTTLQQSPQPTPHKSMIVGDVKINGSNNLHVLQGDDNIVSQTISQSASTSSDFQTVIAALKQLENAIAINDALSSTQKMMTNIPINAIETELEQLKPNKGIVDEAIMALKQALAGVVTLAEPVTKVTERLAKAGLV